MASILVYALLSSFFLFVYSFIIGRINDLDVQNGKGKKENQLFGLSIFLAIVTVLAMKLFLP